MLLALVEAGMGRQDAYVLVQASAMKAFHGDGTFRGNLEADERITSRVPAEKLAALFDLEHALRHVPGVVERALAGERASERSGDRGGG